LKLAHAAKIRSISSLSKGSVGGPSAFGAFIAASGLVSIHFARPQKEPQNRKNDRSLSNFLKCRERRVGPRRPVFDHSFQIDFM